MALIGNRWLIALACAWINLFIFSIFRSAGVVYLEMIKHFNCTYQQAAWSMSLIGSIASITGLFCGFLTHYIPTKWIILLGAGLCSFSVMSTYFATSIEFVTISIGLCHGVGIGFITNLLPVVLNAYFIDKKAIAFGISYAGATLGALIFPVIIKYLFEAYKFNNTMVLMGALMANAAVGAMLIPSTNGKKKKKKKQEEDKDQTKDIKMVPLQPLIDECDTIVYVENNKQYSNITFNKQLHFQNDNEDHVQDSKKDTIFSRLCAKIASDVKLLFDWYFVLCTLTYTSFILQFVAFIIILPDTAKDRNIQDPKWLLSIFSIPDLIGRLLPGWLSYFKLISDKNIYILSITIMSLCMIMLIVLETWLQLVILTLIFGLMTGFQMVLSPAVLSDYMGQENIAVAFGMANFISGLITLVTRPVIIGFKDSFGNYDLLSYILSLVGLLCSFFWAIELIYQIFHPIANVNRRT